MAITWSNNIDPSKRESVDIGPASEFREDINTNFIELFQECKGCIDEIHNKVNDQVNEIHNEISDLDSRLNDRIDEFRKDYHVINSYNTYDTQTQALKIKEELWDQGYRQCNVKLKVPSGSVVVPCKIWANYTGTGSYIDKDGKKIHYATVNNIGIDGHLTILDGTASAPYNGQVIDYIVAVRAALDNGTWIIRGDYDCAIKREYIDDNEQVQKVSYKRSLSYTPKDDIKITEIRGTNDSYLTIFLGKA